MYIPQFEMFECKKKPDNKQISEKLIFRENENNRFSKNTSVFCLVLVFSEMNVVLEIAEILQIQKHRRITD
ncbi:hypothetical protein MsAm2_15830 [Methanolapillus ohkumae]|uniref:Uncharacterized protein n=1 Tax=Methanolapillus ohkumae TaxID=3028298 RepID=A0AA96ZXJ7_9EURY|nr:hypothetical protein MsAm2_15830 [Methanosarcinaceae archaeon Am2]